eukprot:gene28909-38231_t
MVDVVSPYLAELKSSCDLEKIRTFVDSMGLLVSVDCMAGIASTILTAKSSGLGSSASLLAAIGLDAQASLLNGRPESDFAGLTPAADPR